MLRQSSILCGKSLRVGGGGASICVAPRLLGAASTTSQGRRCVSTFDVSADRSTSLRTSPAPPEHGDRTSPALERIPSARRSSFRGASSGRTTASSMALRQMLISSRTRTSGTLLRASRPLHGSKAMLPGGSMMEGHIYDDLMPADHDLKGYHKIGYKVYLKDGMNSKGPWSMYSMRLRECQQMFWKGFYTDPFIMDWGFTNNYKYYLLNPAMYAPVHLTFVLYVWCVMMALSEIALCPDVQVMRRQERYHSKPDCFRLHSYAIPYFNHRLRNIVRKYRWVFIQNEPDWNDYCYSGMRPDGVQGHHVPWVRNSLNYVSYKYYEEDPLATSCSHINFERIHHNLNYKIQERWLEEGETMPEFQTGPQYAASEGGGEGGAAEDDDE